MGFMAVRVPAPARGSYTPDSVRARRFRAMPKSCWLLLALAFAAGCGDEGSGGQVGGQAGVPIEPSVKPQSWPGPADRQLKPDHHPAPYTAAQIRAGCPDGRSSTYRLEIYGEEMLQRWRFDLGDAEGVTWTAQRLKPDGTPEGEPRAQRHEWVSLQAHASFLAAETQVRDETIETPVGTFACMRYTVTRSKVVMGEVDGKTVNTPSVSVTDSWFAYALPGPPVKQEEHVDGRLVSSMELVEHEMPGAR